LFLYCIDHQSLLVHEEKRLPSRDLFSQKVAALLMPAGDLDPDSRAQCATGEPVIAASSGTGAEFTRAANVSAPPFFTHFLVGLTAAASQSGPLTTPRFRSIP